MIRDTNKKLCNLLFYFKKNKAKTTKQLVYDIRLEQTKVKLTKKKTRDKIGNMIALYKI